MNQVWFEMKDVRRRNFSSAVWIPLRAVHFIEKQGQYGYAGFKEDFFGCGTLAVPFDKKTAAEQLGWTEIGISHEHGPLMDKGGYIPSDTYVHHGGQFEGVHLVLEQAINSVVPKEWHLNQDLILALGLLREKDTWSKPSEGYIEVARLKKGADNEPYLIEIRAEHLRDYLCARRMALYITSYRCRHVVGDTNCGVRWESNRVSETAGGGRYECSVVEIHEGGHPYGTEVAVLHVGRTDIGPDDDVPSFGIPTDENTTSKSWTQGFKGRKLYSVQGELWRREWIDPAPAASPRVAGDRLPPTAYFITDTVGTREHKESLEKGGRWLWFSPSVIVSLSTRRGGSLKWYTSETGRVGCVPGHTVHFGINQLGLVNVYAKDIALLPDWEQKLWSGFNVSPEGGVSEELLASQAKGTPSTTKAPEAFLKGGLARIKQISFQKFGFSIIREHDKIEEICDKYHRFRALEQDGLYALAKDLARLTADSINAQAIQKHVPPPEGATWGSLKSLEKLLAKKIGPAGAKKMMDPLVGVYKLRHADAHLPSKETDEAHWSM